MGRCLLILGLLLATIPPSPGAVIVHIRDLQLPLKPRNPIKLAGRVTSERPAALSDGSGEIVLTGAEGIRQGQFLIVEGNWTGQTLAVAHVVLVNELIPYQAGTYTMGSEPGDPSAVSDEIPAHAVSLNAFSLSKYEVTRGEYRAFMDADGYGKPEFWSATGWYRKTASGWTQPAYWQAAQDWGSGWFTQTDIHPVVGVSYYEAEAFCKWAGGRLPTEAEWESAARGMGAGRSYPWGNIWDAGKCNNLKDQNPAGGGIDKSQTAAAGSYPQGASTGGCEDMAGNAWEWVQEWYQSYPGNPNPFDATGMYRVCRGGSFNTYASTYRSAGRSPSSPLSRSHGGGFRMAR